MSNLDSIEPYFQGEIDPAFAIRARFIFEELAKSRPERIIDVGCGRGFYVKLLSLLDFPKEIYGLDLNPKHLEACRRNVGENNKVILKPANIYELPFEDNSADFLICSEVLEHLDKPEKAVSEIRRVLKKGGTAAITVPCKTFPFLWDPLNWILMKAFNTHVNKDIHWLAGIWADHERLYDEETLKSHFTEGFEVVESKSVLNYCWPFSHFIIYGIGKNLVESGFLSSLNRFTFEKPSKAKIAIASFMALPSRLYDRGQYKHGTNHFLAVKKL